MHYSNESANTYALELVSFGIDHAEDGAVISKIMADIKAVGLKVTEQEIRLEMKKLHRQAIKELEEQFQDGTN